MQTQRTSSSSPRTLSFYLRDSNRKGILSISFFFNNSNNFFVVDKFKHVRIHIDQKFDVKILIRKILETCSLPTDYVNKIKSEPLKKPSSGFTGGDTFHGASPFSDEYEIYQRIRKTRQEKTLK